MAKFEISMYAKPMHTQIHYRISYYCSFYVRACVRIAKDQADRAVNMHINDHAGTGTVQVENYRAYTVSVQQATTTQTPFPRSKRHSILRIWDIYEI